MAKRLAVCIGVNNYKNKPSANLQFACRDAQSVATLLADDAYGGFDAVVEIHDAQARKDDIMKALKDLLLNPDLTKDDLALVFFSGHGALDKGDNLFLVPHDADFLPDSSVDVTTTLHIKDLEILLDNTKVGYVLIFLDACHSGASSKLLGRIKYKDSSNILLVGAARYSEKAWEAPEFTHGRFTEGLLKSINAHPTHGEWITLQQTLSLIHLEMQKAGARQTMEVSSHAIDQNILLFKNPMYSLVSTEFVDQIKYLCEISNCTIVPTQPDQTFPHAFVIREPRSFGRYDSTVVICLDNSTVNVTRSHVEQFNALCHALQLDDQVTSGMMVTRNELSASLKEALDKGITTQTVKGIQRNLMNFDRYLIQLIDDFTKRDPDRIGEPPLSQYYVELNARKQESITAILDRISALTEASEIEDETQQQNHAVLERIKKLLSNESSLKDDKRMKLILPLLPSLLGEPESKSVTQIITDWLANENEQAAIVLGGYGTGKTTLARKLACDLAQAYRSSHDKRDSRIPILFPLRRFPKFTAVDMEAAIIAHLKQQCMVANPDFAAFRTMNSAGLFVLIFDGFDEMAVQAGGEIIKRNFLEIMQFGIESNAKVLITSRPEAFLSRQEESEVLLQDDAILPESYPRLDRFKLCPLSSEQIELFLQQRIPLIERAAESGKDWKFYRDQINSTMGLKELAERPVLLDMTIKALPKLIEEGGAVTRPRLYETYLSGELTRQQRLKKRDFLIVDKEQRMHLIQLVARYLYTEKRVELTVEQIQNVLQSEFTPEQRLNFESYVRDFIACSFLVREGDQYRFSHLSFMEYLVAKSLAREIESNAPDILKRFLLTSSVRDFLVELVPLSENSWLRILWAWVNSTVNRDKEEVMYIGGNAITILSHLNEPLSGIDLKDTRLYGANLQRADCRETCFTGSDLEGANLQGANLTNADFRDANLKNVRLTLTIHEDDIALEGDELEVYIELSPLFSGANLKDVRYTKSPLREIVEKMKHLVPQGSTPKVNSVFYDYLFMVLKSESDK